MWGVLYEHLKSENRWTYSYYLIFVMRRILFVFIAVSIPFEYNSIQIIGVLYLNMAIFLYQGHHRPLETRFLNRVEFFNEILISTIYVIILCYTDWVPS
jgi:hypothetical protein